MDRDTAGQPARYRALAPMITKRENIGMRNDEHDENDDDDDKPPRKPEYPTEIRFDRRGDPERAYDQIFSLLQQLSMKNIVKEWIKEVEPKKSRTFPYCGGQKSAPSWWPHDVEHREPDHLKKARKSKSPTAYFR